MAEKSKRLKGSSAYRVKRAKEKRPIRFLEFGILFIFLVVMAYVASFMLQITKGYSKEKEPVSYYLNVQLLNGCGEKGISNKLAAKIERIVKRPLSVQVVDTDNFDNFGVERTFVISRSSDSTAAQIMATQLGIKEKLTFRELDNNYLDIGATLVLGKDYKEVLGMDADAGGR